MKPDSNPDPTPTLRFPEFRDGPAWAEDTLGGIAELYKGKGISKADIDPEGALPCIRYGELYTRYGEIIDDVHSRTNAPASELFLSRQNDVIVPASGETKLDIAKASCVLRDGVALGSDLNVIRTAHDGPFLSYYLNGSKRQDIAKVAQGDAVVHLYPSQLARIAIALPGAAEQRKIADCLRSLDEVIAAQGQKVEVLAAQKNGLMQRLFPREGETLPRLRFPEFRDAPAWEVLPFGALYEFKPTNSYSREQLNYDAGPARNIHYGDIHTRFAATFRIARERVPFVNPGQRLANLKPDAYCQEGDMIFADASEDSADVGKSIEIVDLNGEKVLSGSHTILARQRHGAFVLGFGAHLFKSRRVRADIEKVAQGTKVMAISPARLAKLGIAFPRMQAEQEKLVGCLSSLDDLIAAHTRSLDALKTHKQGLMQALFPFAGGTEP